MVSPSGVHDGLEKYMLWLIAGPSVICRISAPVWSSRVSVISTGQVLPLLMPIPPPGR